jgi:hypothetical protein
MAKQETSVKKLSIQSRFCGAASPSRGQSVMPRRLALCALALAACGVSPIHADATLTYELSGPDAETTVKKFSLARFFARIDDSAEAERYLVFQAGKFFPLYAVDQANQTYRLLTPAVTPRLGPVTASEQAADATAEKNEGPAEPVQDETALLPTESEAQAEAEGGAGTAPETPLAKGEAPAEGASDVASPKSARRTQAATLKPTKETRKVAGIECRVVHEMLDGKPVIEHCMANSARLSVTDRELITLARVFGMARNMEFGWLGVGTKDEEFVSVQSRDLRDNRVLELKSASTQPLAEGYLRIPKTYKLVESDTKGKLAPE